MAILHHKGVDVEAITRTLRASMHVCSQEIGHIRGFQISLPEINVVAN